MLARTSAVAGALPCLVAPMVRRMGQPIAAAGRPIVLATPTLGLREAFQLKRFSAVQAPPQHSPLQQQICD